MSVLARLIPDNPVLTKELRVRMRGSRAYWILTGYLAFLSFILFMQYSMWWNQTQSSGGGMSAGSKIGQSFFIWIVGTQMFLVAFITPAVTSGAITIEKEQRTMEMLEMTRLSRSSIVAGKLLSAVGFIALLLVSSLPLTSICFFLGGVSPEQVAYWYCMLLGLSFVTATVGLVMSTIARTTAAAVVFTYGILLLPGLIAVVVSLLVGVLGNSGAFQAGNPMNPALLGLLTAGLVGANMPDLPFNPASGIIRAWDGRHYYGLTLPVWSAPLLTCALFGITLAVVATARLETFPERKAGQLRLMVTLMFVQQLLFLFGSRFAEFAKGVGGLPGFPLIYMLTYPAILLLLVIPIFVTGEVRPIEARGFLKYLAWGWTPAGWKRGRIASGLPFILFLTGLCVGLYSLSFVFVGKSSAIVSGMPGTAFPKATIPNPNAAPQPTFLPPGAVVKPAPPPPMVTRQDSPGIDVARVILMIVSAAVGMAALGLFLSLLTRNRWAAMALLYVFLAVVLILPAVNHMNYVNDPIRRPPGILINLYYLNPLLGIAELSDVNESFWIDMPLALRDKHIYEVLPLGYGLIALISLILCRPLVRKLAAARPLPYEDMAARV